MAKIAFYLDTRRVMSADIRDVDAGNPGIGGTEYMFFLVAAYLARVHDVSFYVTAHGRYPPGPRYVVVRDLCHAAVAMESAAEDVLILRENEVLPHLALLDAIRQRVIVWAHNFSKPETLRACDLCAQVARYLCVSREQLAMLGGDDIVRKADYVYNGVVTRAYPSEPQSPPGDDVFYMGSLVKTKGFHVLARCWDEVKGAVPTARLHVVGSGRLYDESAPLGPLGLAAAKYEQEFAEYVTRDGRARPDIVFHGVLGADKWRLLRQAKVAVANPTGVGETFCITAVEFGLLGIPVVTRRYGGPKDVVEDGVTGLLFDDPRELPVAIVGLLKDERRRLEMGRRAMASTRARFDIETVIREWQRVITEVMNGDTVPGGRVASVVHDARTARHRPSARSGVSRAAAGVLRSYLRHSPIRAGKPWLLGQVLDGGLHGWRNGPGRRMSTAAGFRLLATLPGVVERVIDLTGVWEPQLTACVRRLLAAGDTFIDLGAGLGYHSLVAWRAVGPAGHVYAFEPDPAMFERLARNVRLNDAGNLHAFDALPAGEAAGADRHSLLGEVPDDTLFGARLIRIDTLSVGLGILARLRQSLPRFSARTAWAITILPSADRDARGDADAVFDDFDRHGYAAFEVPDRYDPRGFLSRARSVPERRLDRPPQACATVLFVRPPATGGKAGP